MIKAQAVKLFGRWNYEEIIIEDEGLKSVITINPIIYPKTGGRLANTHYGKAKINIVERLINRMFVAGHKGKKHKLTSGINTGKTLKNIKNVIEAFEIIEKRLKKNPLQVLVKAIENAAPVEEVITYQKGGIIAREAVVISPLRRVDLALRHLVGGAYLKRHANSKSAGEILANEIILAYNDDPESFAILEKNRREKEAEGAR
ncbi:MAG: 30S ribosomal protein S7 [Candidatus Nanohaloarchaeota archaeon]|nr:30S ribosomal protein S7 [Candidatus Nanohaloarchaeota archaeon]